MEGVDRDGSKAAVVGGLVAEALRGPLGPSDRRGRYNRVGRPAEVHSEDIEPVLRIGMSERVRHAQPGVMSVGSEAGTSMGGGAREVATWRCGGVQSADREAVCVPKQVERSLDHPCHAPAQ